MSCVMDFSGGKVSSDGTVWQIRQQGQERGCMQDHGVGRDFFVCPRCALVVLLGWKLETLGV